MKDMQLHTQVYNVTNFGFLNTITPIDGEGVDYRESKFTLINKYESRIHAAFYWTMIDNTSIHWQIKSTVIKYLNLKKLRIQISLAS